MRRKEEANKVKQKTRKSNTACIHVCSLVHLHYSRRFLQLGAADEYIERVHCLPEVAGPAPIRALIVSWPTEVDVYGRVHRSATVHASSSSASSTASGGESAGWVTGLVGCSVVTAASCSQPTLCHSLCSIYTHVYTGVYIHMRTWESRKQN